MSQPGPGSGATQPEGETTPTAPQRKGSNLQRKTRCRNLKDSFENVGKRQECSVSAIFVGMVPKYGQHMRSLIVVRYDVDRGCVVERDRRYVAPRVRVYCACALPQYSTDSGGGYPGRQEVADEVGEEAGDEADMQKRWDCPSCWAYRTNLSLFLAGRTGKPLAGLTGNKPLSAVLVLTLVADTARRHVGNRRHVLNSPPCRPRLSPVLSVSPCPVPSPFREAYRPPPPPDPWTPVLWPGEQHTADDHRSLVFVWCVCVCFVW